MSMASTQAATTCPDQNAVPMSMPNLLLERILIAAISAVMSCSATLGYVTWRLRRNRKLQEAEGNDDDDEDESEPEEDIALEKQLAWAEHRIKELEALIDAAASKEADAERRAQKASEAAEEAKQKAEEAARQVSEGRARTSHLERAQEALITERDRALKEAQQLSRLQQKAEDDLAKAKDLMGNLERKVKVQGDEKRSSDRRIKELETRLTTVMSAKTRDDEEHASHVKELERQVAEAMSARSAAEADLARVKGKGSDIQRKVEVASAAVGTMRRDLEARERRVAELEAVVGPVQHARAALESQLAASRQRIRELEVELRISQESLRRCDERLRGALKERQEMEARLQRAPSK